jgi:succinate dehydrogenase / fumarate reductase iron-sulfur subunit
MAQRTFSVFRGADRDDGRFEDYQVDCDEGMVVLDAVHKIQVEHDPTLACRWNCKAGKCGSCSAEINGKPKLMCMTRLSDYDESETLTISPMHTFPIIKDLVTNVSWNFQNARRVPFIKPREPDFPDGSWRMFQYEVERPQEFRKCIECFLCQDVCHVLRTHAKYDDFIGPAFFVRAAMYEMNPIDETDRRSFLLEEAGCGLCNITKCCTEVCPEHIQITDNAIIPLKERVADVNYDPVRWIFRKMFGSKYK